MNRSPLPNLHRGWAHLAHICTGTDRVVGAHEHRDRTFAPSAAPVLRRCAVRQCSLAAPPCSWMATESPALRAAGEALTDHAGAHRQRSLVRHRTSRSGALLRPVGCAFVGG
jgi:hypothetical protein